VRMPDGPPRALRTDHGHPFPCDFWGRVADDPGIEEHRSSFVASSRVDLRYFGHLPWIRNRFSATSYPLESTFMLVP
jgi:hypothetical protein